MGDGDSPPRPPRPKDDARTAAQSRRSAAATPPVRRIPALDGLRGVAILLVIAVHGWGFSGGALGVDLFFVLSGFLITGLLLAEHERQGRVSLRRFYRRRAVRLLPALAVVLSAYLLYAGVLVRTAIGDSFHRALVAVAIGATYT